MSLTKADINKQGWEDAEFPIVCETCLGDNPYVRMSKVPYGKECKTCQRPFTVFRWQPGSAMRFKKTEICQNCAKIKNVCQTCILDLQYGLPVQVRDQALGIKPDAPTTDINRQFHAQNMAHQVESGLIDPNTGNSAYDHVGNQDILQQLSRREPNYQRNRAHICSFFVRGECKRGASCPYRHEIPSTDKDLAKQNIRDRYRGINDPVAKKMLNKVKDFRPGLTPPEDKSVTTLFVTGLIDAITKEDLKTIHKLLDSLLPFHSGFFYAFGEVTSIILIQKSKCAFINYGSRASAELAAEKISEIGLTVKEKQLKVVWGKPKPKGPRPEQPQAPTDATKMTIPAPPSLKTKADRVEYASQDPTAKGSAS
ncbi:hypothetical protein DM01DRAFT_1328655 [Hesseltinella vesiculosa]|uniref:Pre-mRNA-splicing factor SLT11 n=1 Tax=Hesseltinella vesiculosa TaxID=101127 RepID=A0A1X2G566_9FUNG|nr:hypothetical protein DM01DRAFT_1328655 [Hesseltinella vesiculosa]